ncbi:hypothetical protein BGZ70_003593 [Mortierella alpina]|uniref:Protein kinase domain-containing protein n=1 Tax=Mortierella alpina TaxID=64518 RepID=A0A9P6JEN9_MORAP|nr:hypothetical protein BGZ70_003593 [Mortierella alpina]
MATKKHANIVKYFGFEKTSETLNIILELCENGSLRSLCKNFGKLPEHLGAMYITQVLDGLIYLHDQGVIHRDIKGANILATKDGLVKLADFGVATLSTDVGDMSVAGTPYWMAPEIIELSGATTASDIWSVGCTVIELLDGEPPYHTLPPMGALYRIVQDDHPPIPESVSAIVRDFLMQCFQKDCNLRVSAKKLSKHPWIQMSKKKASGSQRSREKAIPAYEEAVKSVQQWNEALKGSGTMSMNRNSGNIRRISGGRTWDQNVPAITDLFHAPRPQGRETSVAPIVQTRPERPIAVAQPPQFHLQTNNANNINKATTTNNLEPEICTDNWDDDFAEISSLQLAALEFRDQDDEISKTIRAAPSLPKPQSATVENDIDEDDFEDDGQDLRLKLKKLKQMSARQPESSAKPSGSLTSRPKAITVHVPIDLVRSRSAPGQLLVSPSLTSDELQGYREEEDDDDFSDLFEGVEDRNMMYQDEGLTLQTRLSNHSWFGNDAGSDEDDPFAEVDEGFDEIDLEANIAREKHARACASIAEQFRLLEGSPSDSQLQAVCDRLTVLLTENPDMRGPMIANHGAIPLLDLIENCEHESAALKKLLNILNLVIRNDFALQENLCLVGAIPVLIRFTSKRFSKEIQLAAAVFIQQICHTNPLTLQMFISCRGLRVLIKFLQGNYSTQKELVWIAINGIHSVFNLQSLTPRNDFCRLLAKQGLLEPLSSTLYNTIHDPNGLPYTEKIVNVFLIFSQGDSPVKELLASHRIVHCMLDSLQNLPPHLCVAMLKCIRNISVNSNTLDVLQNANAIRTLVKVLGERTGSIATDVCNHVFTTLFNLCRINKSRQEEAAQAGLIPHLQQIAESTSPLKQFALPILCDMAHAGRACRNALWNNDVLPVYLRLFKDPYWQVNAMDAVHVWLQDEKSMQDEESDVEQFLLLKPSLNYFVQAFLTAKANSFENILEPFHKIIRLSPSIACGIAVPGLFQRLLDRLAHPKAVVRLNLLRILRAIFDVHPERLKLVMDYGIADVVHKIAEEDSGLLVKELAREILEAFEESDSEAALSSREDNGDSASNRYNSFPSSSSDFFGLRPLTALRQNRKDEDEGEDEDDEEEDESETVVRWQEASRNHPTGEASLSKFPIIQRRLKSGSQGSITDSIHDVDDLFLKEVEGLEIKTGMDPRTSSHQRPHDGVRESHGSYESYLAAPSGLHSNNGEGSSTAAAAFKGQPTRRRVSINETTKDKYNTNNNSNNNNSNNNKNNNIINNSDSGESEDDLFVTSRGWLDQQDGDPDGDPDNGQEPDWDQRKQRASHAFKACPQDEGDIFEGIDSDDDDGDGDDDEPRTVKMVARPQFGHHKSRSLGEIIETCLDEDLEKRQRLLQGLQSHDLSESMILRSELPKIRLELLDIDHFPAWNRQDSDEDESGSDESDGEEGGHHGHHTHHRDQDDSDDRDRQCGTSSSSSSHHPDELDRRMSPRSSSDYGSITSAEELTRILEEYHGTRRPLMGEGMSRGGSRSGASSGSSSGDPTIRLSEAYLDRGAGVGRGQPPRRPHRVVGSLASIAAWQAESDSNKDDSIPAQPTAASEAAPLQAPSGLTLVTRQEYDSTLNFSDDDDEDDDKEEEVEEDEKEKEVMAEVDDTSNRSEDDTENAPHLGTIFAKQLSTRNDCNDDDPHDDYGLHIGGNDDPDDNSGWTMKLQRLTPSAVVGATTAAAAEEDGEDEDSDWDRDQEQRLGCDTPRYRSIISTSSSSISTSSTPAPLLSTLRRRNSHLRSE